MLSAALLLSGPITIANDEEGGTNNTQISCSNGEKAEGKNMRDTLKDLMEEMKTHLDEIKEDYAKPHEVS